MIWPKSSQHSVLIAMIGDVMIGRQVSAFTAHKPPEYVWGNVLPILLKTDINLINLETTLTTSTHVVPKTFNFKALPSQVQSLKAARIDVANLANNHILDFGPEGLFETIQTLT